MGLFDIFRKKKKIENEQGQSQTASASSSESVVPVSTSQSTSTTEPASQSTLQRPLNEKVELVTDSEAAIWQAALDNQTPASQPSSVTPIVTERPMVNEDSQSDQAETLVSQHSTVDEASQSESQSTLFVSQSESNSVLAHSQSELASKVAVEDSQSEYQLMAEQSQSDSSSTAAISQPNSELAAEDADQVVYDRGLKKSRSGFADRFNRFLSNFRSVDENFFEDLEETLIGADVGFDLALRISDELREEVKLQNAKRKEDVQAVIIQKMVELYEADGLNEDSQMHFAPAGEPTVILMVGVNGVGKTTTIGKMADRFRQEGRSVLLAAADTFRAGATKQLQEWGQRSQVPVVAGKEKADPASVVYEGLQRAKHENYDILLVDTAGRLQNNVNLMQELAKMKRIIQRELPAAPQEVLLVLDATTGQNALQQAKLFKDSSDVTGIVLTKVDGTAKGGIVFAIRSQMHLPVKWIGFGEKASDLRVFNSEEFIYGLFKDLITE
ncbi:signal recognition particle-docking protein FtsY [Convivina intestini]|uniref:Signal recognition particle receptor FtsY n=1 Tax=Convivina intestini TaxID=1505726 RepID=A0A2U1DC71_9LACO|nr:signal recognition particle-docking protein FtsY [Convivina intestini]PVY85267.1 fused signal recognition particle receptor [Convivina intestini]CAH1852680.1 Signal recognition particle receptor FtsY [Convivina intestini]SDB86967.1 fused signal recognition particle receptor [Leuconostocaceae bacterium R-53105]